MTKTEKKRLAEIVIGMKHGGGATYETYTTAEDILKTFPCIIEDVWDLEEEAYTKKVVEIISSFLSNSINPAVSTRGKYETAYQLRLKSYDFFKEVVDDYCVESDITAEVMFDLLDEHHDTYNRSKAIREILEDVVWKESVDNNTNDSLLRQYLKGELEEYSLINNNL